MDTISVQSLVKAAKLSFDEMLRKIPYVQNGWGSSARTIIERKDMSVYFQTALGMSRGLSRIDAFHIRFHPTHFN